MKITKSQLKSIIKEIIEESYIKEEKTVPGNMFEYYIDSDDYEEDETIPETSKVLKADSGVIKTWFENNFPVEVDDIDVEGDNTLIITFYDSGMDGYVGHETLKKI